MKRLFFYLGMIFINYNVDAQVESIQFSGAPSSDFFIDVEPGTRIFRTRNWNTQSPNIAATGLHTGTGIFEGDINVSGNGVVKGNLLFGLDGGYTTISGPANSGAIQIKTHSGLGGSANRYLRLGWKDNNAVFSPVLSINDDLNVGIGTTDPGVKLDVIGTIRATEVKVCLNQGCDFVFDNEYKLLSIQELDKFIKLNKHLPDIEPAAKMENEGINLSEMNAKLLQKIEEQTLYIIELNKQMQELKKQMEKFKKQ